MDNGIENKQMRVKAQLEIILNIIEQENSLFLSISGLAIALIVILSLNNNLIYFSVFESRVLLTIFLLIVMITLGTHMYFLNRGKKKSMGIIDEIMEKKISNQLNITRLEKLLAYVPITVAITFFICIAYIIYVLWR